MIVKDANVNTVGSGVTPLPPPVISKNEEKVIEQVGIVNFIKLRSATTIDIPDVIKYA